MVLYIAFNNIYPFYTVLVLYVIFCIPFNDIFIIITTHILSHIVFLYFRVKFVGLFVILLVGLSTAYDLWVLLGDLTSPMVGNASRDWQ